MALPEPRWAFLAAVALAAVPRAAQAQNAQSEWTTPVYHPPPAPATPPAVTPSPVAPGYAPGYGPPVYAPPEPLPPPPPAPVHAGFFLRLHLGIGLDSFSSSGGSTGTTQISGPGPSLALAVGGAIAPNLALFGTFFETGVGGPATVKTTRTDIAATDNVGLGGLGGGVVYYLEPLNLYLSGALALTVLVVNDVKGNTLAETKGGIGFEGMVGKEWWVSQHWGVGSALEIVAATAMKETKDTSVSWTGEAFNIVLSGSYF